MKQFHFNTKAVANKILLSFISMQYLNNKSNFKIKSLHRLRSMLMVMMVLVVRMIYTHIHLDLNKESTQHLLRAGTIVRALYALFP